MNINMIGQQFWEYGSVGQCYFRGSQSFGESTALSGNTASKTSEQMMSTGIERNDSKMSTAFMNNVNSIWANLQTGESGSTEEDSFAAQILADFQEKFTQLDVNGDGTLSEKEFISEIENLLQSIQENKQNPYSMYGKNEGY